MSSIDNLADSTYDDLREETGRLSWWQRLDQMLVTWGERLNPILVKETRQALKSRQFLITFFLLLISCWFWTLLGTASVGAYVYYRPSGHEVFFGYYVILAIAIGMVVPYSTFRSLVGENDENTFDLLSITTLSPRQIIAGKLGSAVVQIGVYLAAVGPCLAFTYLLRGIDIFSIGFVLSYTVLGSLALSALGLLVASVATAKFLQILLSVGVIIGLFFVTVGGISLTEGILRYGGGSTPVSDPDFIVGCLFTMTLYVTSFAIAFLAAASRVTFPSENRSTALRVACMVQFLALAGWIIFPWQDVSDDVEVASALLGFSALLWFVLGMFMTVESPQLSRRVTRQLPSKPLFRHLFFWFMPGPGTGYIFCLANLAGLCLAAFLVYLWDQATALPLLGSFDRRASATMDETIVVASLGVLCWSYLAVFLGLGKLAIMITRKFIAMNIFLGLGLHLLILGCAIMIPFLIQFSVLQDMSGDYSMLHITNPFYSIPEMGDHWQRHQYQLPAIAIIVSAAAMIVLLLNAKSVLHEVRRLRTAIPTRIIEDEIEIEEALEPSYKSPWD